MTSLASYWLGRLQARVSRLVTLRVAFALMTLSTLLAGGATLSSIRTQQAFKDEREAAAIRACEAGNETREILRRMVKDGGITSGVTGGEALITIASDPDPADVKAYRDALTKLLVPALEGIVNTLPARRWDPESGTCVDVPLDTGG